MPPMPPADAPEPEPPVATPISRRRRAMARLRGFQTLEQLRAGGLRAAPDVSIAGRTFLDPGFLWAITIGDRTTISHDVRIIAHDAAGRHFFGYTEVRPVTIGSGCYIGANVIVLPGARIGDGSIVGAGAIVRGELPAGVVAAGNPATVLGSVADYVGRHRERMASHPTFDVAADGLTPERAAELSAALDERGRIYLR